MNKTERLKYVAAELVRMADAGNPAHRYVNDPANWIAFKLSCSVADARSLVRQVQAAKEAATHGEPNDKRL